MFKFVDMALEWIETLYVQTIIADLKKPVKSYIFG